MSAQVLNCFAFESLPFQVHNDDLTLPESDDTAKELLRDGHINMKYAKDGIQDFFAVRIASSNAKAIARYFELTMGFKEIAYKGLETKLTKLASHVLKNGNVLIEVMNTLTKVEENYPNYPNNQIINYQTIKESMNEEILNKLQKIVFEIGEKYIGIMMGHNTELINYEIGINNFTSSVTRLAEYKEIIRDYQTNLTRITDLTEKLLYDIFDGYAIQGFLLTHGEGVHDIMLMVEDAESIFKRATRAGAKIVKPPKVYSDHQGSVKMATIQIPQTDIQHTLVENIDYKGEYLPGYGKPLTKEVIFDKTLTKLPPINLVKIDHCVENYTWNQMMAKAEFYAQILGLHKFWSVDEQDVSTGETALRSIVMASSNGQVKIPINEPAKGKKKSQIEEFYDFNGGPGVQHLALRTYDILECVRLMQKRGIEFNTISQRYYTNLKSRLQKDRIELFEEIKAIEKYGILVDYDPSTKYIFDEEHGRYRCNYILQIFTKPNHDRPTLFIEIIQRHHHNGFGKGTFKGLFETIEEQQRLRGTLTDSD